MAHGNTETLLPDQYGRVLSPSSFSAATRATGAGLRMRHWPIRACYIYSSIGDASRRVPQTLLVTARRRPATRGDARPENSEKSATRSDAMRPRSDAMRPRARGISLFLCSSSGGAFFLSFLTNWDCPPALCSSADFCMFSSTSQRLKQADVPFWFETNTNNSNLDSSQSSSSRLRLYIHN